MYCQNCGTEGIAGKYCQKCGTFLDDSASQEVQYQQTQYQQYSRTYQAQSNYQGQEAHYTAHTIDYSEYKPYYQNAFLRIEQTDGNDGGGFNWCAFFFGSLWALFKGAWLSSLVTFLIVLVTSGFASPIIWILYGIRGNRLLYNVYIKQKQTIF